MSEANVLKDVKGIIPHIVVKGGAEAIEFYKAGLGAVEVSRMPTPDGRLMHASLQVGGGYLMLCDDFPEYCGGVSRLPTGPASVTLHLNVPCADTAIAQAEKAGAKVTMPAQDMFWGDRYGQITDPFGHSWSLSSPLTEEQKAAAAAKWAEQSAGAPV
jgi:PhnB protein